MAYPTRDALDRIDRIIRDQTRRASSMSRVWDGQIQQPPSFFRTEDYHSHGTYKPPGPSLQFSSDHPLAAAVGTLEAVGGVRTTPAGYTTPETRNVQVNLTVDETCVYQHLEARKADVLRQSTEPDEHAILAIEKETRQLLEDAFARHVHETATQGMVEETPVLRAKRERWADAASRIRFDLGRIETEKNIAAVEEHLRKLRFADAMFHVLKGALLRHYGVFFVLHARKSDLEGVFGTGEELHAYIDSILGKKDHRFILSVEQFLIRCKALDRLASACVLRLRGLADALSSVYATNPFKFPVDCQSRKSAVPALQLRLAKALADEDSGIYDGEDAPQQILDTIADAEEWDKEHARRVMHFAATQDPRFLRFSPHHEQLSGSAPMDLRALLCEHALNVARIELAAPGLGGLGRGIEPFSRAERAAGYAAPLPSHSLRHPLSVLLRVGSHCFDETCAYTCLPISLGSYVPCDDAGHPYTFVL